MKTRPSTVCNECGATEEEHGHAFSPETVTCPDECVCDDADWDESAIPGICDAYQDDGDGRCVTCEHDGACHGAGAPKDAQ